jgi:hypothetical protein
VTATTISHVFQREQTRFFIDNDGALAAVKDNDEVIAVSLDYSNLLDSGETISTSTWTDDGLTTSTRANTTTATSCLAARLGDTKNTVVTSTGRTLVHYVRFYAAEGLPRRHDYNRGL